MTVFALESLQALEVAYTTRPGSMSYQGALVTLWQDVRHTLKVASRTVTSPDRWRAPTTVSTSSSHPAQDAILTVVIGPFEEALSVSSVGLDDQVPFMLASIKRMTGWSWERIAAILGRSRQAIHGWTLGKEITEPNRELLARLHTTLAFIDCGSVEQNRALLHTTTSDGGLVADLLNVGRFDEVRKLLGSGDGDRNFTARLQLAASAQQNGERTHWFDRLGETRGEEQGLEIVPSGERKRVVARRRG